MNATVVCYTLHVYLLKLEVPCCTGAYNYDSTAQTSDAQTTRLPLNFLVALQKFFVNCKTARESRASSTAPTNPKIPYGVRLNYSIRHSDDRFLCQKEQGFFLAKESSICNQSCVLTADFRI